MTVERLHYLPERLLKETGIFKVGVVVMVVNQRGEVWVNREISKKSVKGQIAPLCETRREGEFIWQNTQAALVEEMGVTQEDTGDFFWDDKVSYGGRFSFPEGNKVIHADLVLLLYTGNKKTFISRNEVEPVGWRDPAELLENPDFRSGPKPAIQFVLEHGLIDQLLNSPGEKKPILSGIDPEEFYSQRPINGDINNDK